MLNNAFDLKINRIILIFKVTKFKLITFSPTISHSLRHHVGKFSEHELYYRHALQHHQLELTEKLNTHSNYFEYSIDLCFFLDLSGYTYEVFQIIRATLYLPDNCNITIDWHIEKSFANVDILNGRRDKMA